MNIKDPPEETVREKVPENDDRKPQAEHVETYVHKTMLFSEVINRYPETWEVFAAYGLHCIGCRLNVYDTVQDAGIIHGINPDMLVHDLNLIITLARKEAAEFTKADSHENMDQK